MRWNTIFLSVILNIRSPLSMQGCIAKLMRTVTDTIRSSLLIICCKRIISAMKKYCVIGESSSRKLPARSLTAASVGFVKTKLHKDAPSLFAGGFLFAFWMCHSILFLHQFFMLFIHSVFHVVCNDNIAVCVEYFSRRFEECFPIHNFAPFHLSTLNLPQTLQKVNRGALAGVAIRQRCDCKNAWHSRFGKGKVEICAANTTDLAEADMLCNGHYQMQGRKYVNIGAALETIGCGG